MITAETAPRHARKKLGGVYDTAHTIIVDADGNVYSNNTVEEVSNQTKNQLFIVKPVENKSKKKKPE